MKQEEFDFSFFDVTKECSLLEEHLYNYEKVNFVEVYYNTGNEYFPFGENIHICVTYKEDEVNKIIQDSFPFTLTETQFNSSFGKYIFEKIKNDFTTAHSYSLGSFIDKK
jgi:hypothetical protein